MLRSSPTCLQLCLCALVLSRYSRLCFLEFFCSNKAVSVVFVVVVLFHEASTSFSVILWAPLISVHPRDVTILKFIDWLGPQSLGSRGLLINSWSTICTNIIRKLLPASVNLKSPCKSFPLSSWISCWMTMCVLSHNWSDSMSITLMVLSYTFLNADTLQMEMNAPFVLEK